MIKNKNWKLDNRNFREILNYLMENDKSEFNWEISYSFLYGGGSAFIHGTWYDIELNHLERKNGKYLPKYSFVDVDPRYILPQGKIPIMACIDFLEWRKTDSERFLIKVLKDLDNLLNFLNEIDEIRIGEKDNNCLD